MQFSIKLTGSMLDDEQVLQQSLNKAGQIAMRPQRANLDNKNFIERNEEIRQVITYYENHKNKMSYARHLKNNLPIGSGVTEAACKVLVKQRMCISGSRWKNDGASCVLALRALKLTKGRWQQFWSYVMRHGHTLY